MNKKQNSLMRFSRTERLAQLSEQEIVIERKKREIQAKLEAQKKKQTEEALKKLESSREIKNNKAGFSKKSWTGSELLKSSNKEKPVEQLGESLTNAFSNDGSFLDQFKKLSQTGLSAKNVDMQTLALSKTMEADPKNMKNAHDEDEAPKTIHKEDITDRDHKLVNDGSQLPQIQELLDSKVQFQRPPLGAVQFLSQHPRASGIPSANDNTGTIIPSNSLQTPQLLGGMQNSVNAFNSKIMQLNAPLSPSSQLALSGSVFKLIKAEDSTSEVDHNLLSKTTLASVQQPLPITSQRISPPSPRQVQNIPPPSVLPSELPKIRSESISMTLKTNPIKKLEAIPNPLEIDQPPSPSTPKQNLLSFAGMKESSKQTFLNTTTILENVSYDRESSKISSAFYNNDEDGEEDGVPLDEKYHHWAELVARCGDSFEDSLRKRNQNNSNIRFLLDKNSKEYQSFRKLVLIYQKRIKFSEEGPTEKTSKLNSQSFEGSMEEIIPSNNETTLSQTRSSDEDSCDGKGHLSPEKVSSVARQEVRAHSNCFENQEDYLLHNKASEPTSKEDCFLPFQKQSFPKGENPNAGTHTFVSEQFKTDERRKRKRKSRWGDAAPTSSAPGAGTNLIQCAGKLPTPKSTLLSQLTRSDPGLIQYARQTFGSTNLSEEDWKKAEDHYKINLLYQDMVKKRAEVEKLERQGKFKYEYDSDEDTEGGTWEHKLRQQEMQATQLWAEELTRQAAGKHHIGDFLPPEELERFMEKYNAVKEGREPDLSDYKEYKLKEDNVGYRLLQKMGWNEGQGLGQDGSGITNPVNKATTRHENQGLGIERPDGLEPGDDEYDAYRKRMMLAYRFRPNPLNNPRRPYY